MTDISENSRVKNGRRQLLLPGAALPTDSCLQASRADERVEATGAAIAPAIRPRLRLVRASAELDSKTCDERLPCESNPALQQLMTTRSLLMLQGPIGPLFDRIARWKRSGGHRVLRVVFNGGDKFFCPDPGAVEYRQLIKDWPQYLRSLILGHDIDGVLLFGQSRPYHREAIRICRLMGVPVFVMEEGYIRPGFMTLESGGVNASSTTLESCRVDDALADDSVPSPAKVRNHRWHLTCQSILYYLFLWLGKRHYAGYIHHRHTSILRYASYWVGAAIHFPLTRWQDSKAIGRLDKSRPYFFVPLQVDSDAQVVYHSRFLDVLQFVEEVMQSFADHAPDNAQLIIKQHPLARGHLGMRKAILAIAECYGIRQQVIFVCSCKIYQLLEKVAGVVTINSTVGLQAIAHNAPVKLMGEAIYDHPKVVDPQPLHTFWRNPRKPDPQHAAAFHRAVKVLTQVPVGLYDPSSIDLGWGGSDPSTRKSDHGT